MFETVNGLWTSIDWNNLVHLWCKHIKLGINNIDCIQGSRCPSAWRDFVQDDGGVWTPVSNVLNYRLISSNNAIRWMFRGIVTSNLQNNIFGFEIWGQYIRNSVSDCGNIGPKIHVGEPLSHVGRLHPFRPQEWVWAGRGCPYICSRLERLGEEDSRRHQRRVAPRWCLGCGERSGTRCMSSSRAPWLGTGHRRACRWRLCSRGRFPCHQCWLIWDTRLLSVGNNSEIRLGV